MQIHSSKMTPALLSAFAVAALQTVATVATAEPTETANETKKDGTRPAPETEAKRLWEEAKKLRDSGDYAGAIERLKDAYSTSPRPGHLYALGKAYLTIDKPVEAIEAFERYLAMGNNQVPPAQRVEVEAALRKLRERVGFVDLRVKPPGAAVSLDGVELGADKLATKLRVAAGRHTLVASLAGYAPTTLEIEVIGGKGRPFEVNLEALPMPKGTLQVECQVPDVVVTANEMALGTTPFTAPALLQTGNYKIRFERAGYVDDDYSVSVSAERPASVKCGLKLLAPLPAELKARLRIMSAGRQIQVRVDGDEVPPELDLPSGRHHVRVSRAGYRTWERDVNLRAGTTVDLTPELSSDGSRPPRVNGQQAVALRTWAYVVSATGLALGGGALGLWVWNEQRVHDEIEPLKREIRDADARASSATTQEQRALATAQASEKTRQELNRFASIRFADGIEIGMVIGASTLLCAGTLMWLTSGESSPLENVAVVPHRGGAGLAWAGRY